MKTLLLLLLSSLLGSAFGAAPAAPDPRIERSQSAAAEWARSAAAGGGLHLLLVQDDGAGDLVIAVVARIELSGPRGELKHENSHDRSVVRVSGRYEVKADMLRIKDSAIQVKLDFASGVPVKNSLLGAGFGAESSSPERVLKRGVPRLVAGSRQDSVSGAEAISVGSDLYLIWR
jgi:hypothetical protein